MSKMSDLAIDQLERTQEETALIENFIDSVDIFYTQFLEIAFFLKISATENMAISFVKRKLPQLTKEQILYLVDEITRDYRDHL